MPASWGVGHVEALRSGHAWVNVSAQLVGIEGTDDASLPLYLRVADPDRYAALSHPGDSFSYDIFTQVTAAIRADGGILGDLTADVIPLGAVNERQPDSAFFRLWELTGAAHNDNYQLVLGRDDVGIGADKALVVENTSILGLFTCNRPLNSGPYPWVYMAALNALESWARTGEAAPEAERLAVNDDESDYRYDDLGNVLGGIRTPYVDAAPGRISGELNAGGFGCRLSGTTELFDAATMASLYVDRDGYIAAVAAAADEAVAAGFLLEADAERIRAAAGLQWDALSP